MPLLPSPHDILHRSRSLNSDDQEGLFGYFGVGIDLEADGSREQRAGDRNDWRRQTSQLDVRKHYR